ncbi:MAG: hypothetical protein ACI8ZM_003093 [Crocinitomix sp.]|jgi:hypothetical protein
MKTSILSLFVIGLSCNLQAQDFAWAADYANGNSWVTAMTVDNVGSAYTAVIYTETVDFDPGPANFPETGGAEGQTSIQKLDVNGNLIWVKSFPEVIGDGIIGNGFEIKGITVDGSGNLYLTGGISGAVDVDPGDEELVIGSFGMGGDIVIVKLNSDGELMWVNTMGSNCIDTGVDIELDQNGDVCVTGTFCQTVDFDSGVGVEELTAEGAEGTDVFILKLSNTGDFIWVKSIESEFYDEVFDLEVDKNNNIYIGGDYTNSADFDVDLGEYILTSEGVKEAFLLKLDEAGLYDWVITVPGSSYSKFSSIALDSYDNIYAVGNFSGAEIDFDPGAGVLNLSSIGQTDIFVTKYTVSGELIWANQLGGTGIDRDALIEVSGINTLYITGNYGDDIDVDPSVDEYILEHTTDVLSNFDIFLTTLNEDGDFLQAISFTGDHNDYCIELLKGTEGSVYLAGTTHSDLDIDPAGGEFLLHGDNYEPEAYVLKLQDGNVGINGDVEDVNISLYPNPTQGALNIKLDKTYADLHVVIFDQTGRVIYQNEYLSTSLIRMEFNAPNGIYFVQIMSDDIDRVIKVSKTN